MEKTYIADKQTQDAIKADYKKLSDGVNQLNDDIDDGVFGSDQYNDTTPYAVDNYCIYDNKLWKCKTACSGVTPIEGTYWEQVTISSIQTKLTCDNVLGSFSEKPIISSISTGPNKYAEIEVVSFGHSFGLILVEQNNQSVGMGLFYASGCVNISGNYLSFYDNIVKITTQTNWSCILIIGSNYKLRTYGDDKLTYFNM